MDKITLHEQFRLIERSESEINGAWKGAHLLLFFLAFVFGSFCTFCFHMLMYLFDEKCVLFPKLLSLNAMRNNIIYDVITDKEDVDSLPVDFVSTHWVDKSACYLPTYVPLLSGIFGLVWTTMFLMCSSGSRVLTGLQRPWRILPLVFLFSLAMGALCIYTSIITHNGLHELCVKLGEIVGSSSCTYTVNVATLAFERRIRGVYQATRLTIVSAWLHTACWLAAALLALARVLLVVDFRLVRIRAELLGNVDKMLERHEEHIRTVSPEAQIKENFTNTQLSSPNFRPGSPSSTIRVHYKNKSFATDSSTQINQLHDSEESFYSLQHAFTMAESPSVILVESHNIPYVRRLLFDLLNKIDYENTSLKQLEKVLFDMVNYDVDDTMIRPPNNKNVDVEQSSKAKITSKVESTSKVSIVNEQQTEIKKKSKLQKYSSSIQTQTFVALETNTKVHTTLDKSIKNFFTNVSESTLTPVVETATQITNELDFFRNEVARDGVKDSSDPSEITLTQSEGKLKYRTQTWDYEIEAQNKDYDTEEVQGTERKLPKELQNQDSIMQTSKKEKQD